MINAIYKEHYEWFFILHSYLYLNEIAGAALRYVIELAHIIFLIKNGSKCHCGYFNVSKLSIYESKYC